MNLRAITFALIALAAPFLTSAQDAPTAEDRKHWVEVAHKLEATPLDDEVDQDARLAVAEIAVAQGFHISLCSDFYNDFNESHYQYHNQIRYLYMLGGAAYQIETGKTDSEGTTLYALRSVLKGYAAILKDNTDAKDKKLDELARSDEKNKLVELIAKRPCKTQPNQP